MPHTGLPPCLSEMGSGKAESEDRAVLSPGSNGALSPASPPGFVTALTTARSRDVPAECFDERLPRRLPPPSARVLALLLSPYPQAPKIPPCSLAFYCECTYFRLSPCLRGNDPLTVTAGP